MAARLLIPDDVRVVVVAPVLQLVRRRNVTDQHCFVVRVVSEVVLMPSPDPQFRYGAKLSSFAPRQSSRTCHFCWSEPAVLVILTWLPGPTSGSSLPASRQNVLPPSEISIRMTVVPPSSPTLRVVQDVDSCYCSGAANAGDGVPVAESASVHGKPTTVQRLTSRDVSVANPLLTSVSVPVDGEIYRREPKRAHRSGG